MFAHLIDLLVQDELQRASNIAPHETSAMYSCKKKLASIGRVRPRRHTSICIYTSIYIDESCGAYSRVFQTHRISAVRPAANRMSKLYIACDDRKISNGK